jgi:mannitol/fructose-specific phosphotransferase system IIA component (Ntr-type)
MKLSELSTERATDVLCEIAPYFMNIATDEELVSELKAAIDFKEADTMAEKITLVVGKLSKILPILLKKRKADLFGILGALNEKSIEEIANQNIIKTMSQIKDISKDKELLDFFKSCTGTEESE